VRRIVSSPALHPTAVPHNSQRHATPLGLSCERERMNQHFLEPTFLNPTLHEHPPPYPWLSSIPSPSLVALSSNSIAIASGTGG